MQSLFFMKLVMLYRLEVSWADSFSLSTASTWKTSFCWDGPLGSSICSGFKGKARRGTLTHLWGKTPAALPCRLTVAFQKGGGIFLKHTWRRLFLLWLEGREESWQLWVVVLGAGEQLFLMCTWLFMHGLSSSSWANFSLRGFQEKGLSFVITLLIHHSSQRGTAYAGGEVREKVICSFSFFQVQLCPASPPSHPCPMPTFLTERA